MSAIPGYSRLHAATLACLLAVATGAAPAAPATRVAAPATADLGLGVPDADAAQLTPAFWTQRLAQPDAVLLDGAAIAAQNAELLRTDPSMHDLRALPAEMERGQVAALIEARSRRPSRPLFEADGRALSGAALDRLVEALDLGAIPPRHPLRYGLVVQRAPLRTFPTPLRVFTDPRDQDIDRFQESALFPGTPVAILHRSRDRAWLFVLSRDYAAWMPARDVAEGARDAVLEYASREPSRVVLGAKVRTAFTPELPALSELQLDMGTRAPLARPADGVVSGQSPHAGWTLALPLRRDDGTLAFATALLPASADSAAAPPPLTTANLIRQAFKFLGERYGWGHDYNGRDCSGFIAEVYRSFGVLLPRNTGDQAASPALHARAFAEGDDDARRAAIAALETGDLVYVPGHVLLVIGRIGDEPWVIHDIHDGRVPGADGRLQSLHLNAVSVTPLSPLRLDDGSRMIERVTSIVRIGRSAK